jgi:hypothetical protein
MPTPFAPPSAERLPGAPSDAAASEISAAVAAAAELIARAGQNEAQRAEAERAAIAAEREAIEEQRQTAETIIRQQQAAADAGEDGARSEAGGERLRNARLIGELREVANYRVHAVMRWVRVLVNRASRDAP